MTGKHQQSRGLNQVWEVGKKMDALTDRAVCLRECVCVHVSAGLLASGGPCVECVRPARVSAPVCSCHPPCGEEESRTERSGPPLRLRICKTLIPTGRLAPSLRPQVSMEEAQSSQTPSFPPPHTH